jgi:hypothetical protein
MDYTVERESNMPPEMEFLDISLTKYTSLLLYTIHSPFYWRILQETIIYTGFRTHTKKSAEIRKLESIHGKPFAERKNEV